MALTPLKYQELWHREPPRTSQRQALIRLLEPSRPDLGVAGMILLSLLFGGNRAGKSMAGLMLAAAMAAGEDAHIDTRHGRVYWVRTWMARNAIPSHLIPKGPATVWLGSSTFDLACDTVRPTLRTILPGDTRWVHWADPQQGRAEIPGGGLIVSKAYQQYNLKPQSWEGASIRFAALDEQPDKFSMMAALFGRLADQSGRALMMLTPLRGKRDWLYLEYVKRRPPSGRIEYIHGRDNPNQPAVALAAFLANTARWQRGSRELGQFSDPEGTVYAIRREVHVIAPFPIPANWLRWGGGDWGARAPHVVWAAEDRETGRLYVYREIAWRRESKESPVLARQLVRHAIDLEALEVKQLPGVPRPGGDGEDRPMRPTWLRVADSESPDSIEEAQLAGWTVTPAEKGRGSISDGISSVQALLECEDPLKPGVTIAPRLYFFEGCCDILLEEMEGLRWSEAADPDAAPIDPLCADHGPDALRYLIAYRRSCGLR